MFLKPCLKKSRCVARYGLLAAAWIWFNTEIARILVATFGPQHNVTSLVALLEPYTGRLTPLTRLLGETWQLYSAVVIVTITQEITRWTKGRHDRKIADRMLFAFGVGGFTFLGTLVVVGRLAGFTPVVPESTRESIVGLLILTVSSWGSRMLHPATRRALRRHRWIKPLLTSLVQKALNRWLKVTNHGPGGRHAPNHKNGRRAA